MAIPRRASTATKIMRNDSLRSVLLKSHDISGLMYANGVKGSRRRLLIILQGMDASGKGGIVRHVFSQGDPMGMHYHGFGAPKGEEKDRSFVVHQTGTAAEWLDLHFR